MSDEDPQGQVVQESEKSQPEPEEADGWKYDKYLQGIEDPNVRSLVSSKLEDFRVDTDVQANKKIQEQAERLKEFDELGDLETLQFANDLRTSFINDAPGTIAFIQEEFARETGRDIVKEFMDTVEQDQETIGEAAPQPTDEEGNALTRDDVQKMLDGERANRDEAEQRDAAEGEAVARTDKWIAEALDIHGLEVDQKHRDYIVHLASEFIGSAQAETGEEAIKLAVKEFNEDYGSKFRKKSQPAPKVAIGGAPVMPTQTQPRTKAERKDAQLQILKAYNRP